MPPSPGDHFTAQQRQQSGKEIPGRRKQREEAGDQQSRLLQAVRARLEEYQRWH